MVLNTMQSSSGVCVFFFVVFFTTEDHNLCLPICVMFLAFLSAFALKTFQFVILPSLLSAFAHKPASQLWVSQWAKSFNM